MGDFNSMKKAYEASNKLIKKKMEKERADDFKELTDIKDTEIIIVRGVYDKIELVFDLIKIPYALIDGSELDSLKLMDWQTLIINCPGDSINDRGLKNIQQFVEKGGFLFTTDWVLRNVIEKIFPGYIEYNDHSTNDDVVKVEVVDKDSPYLKGLFDEKSDPQWWLESSSYPIKILNKKDVKVLIQSREMKEKYGESPIVVTFNYKKGTIFHLTSHYYLQRTELRTERHKSKASEYVMSEKALSPKEVKEANFSEDELEELSLGEMEAAYTSAQFMINAIVERKKKLKKEGSAAKSAQKK